MHDWKKTKTKIFIGKLNFNSRRNERLRAMRTVLPRAESANYKSFVSALSDVINKTK